MGTAQADRIWRSFSRIETTPEDLAEQYVARLIEFGLDDRAGGLDLGGKHRSIAAALSLVAHNADMLDSIRGVLTKSRVPVIGNLPDRASMRRARDLMLETIEDASPEAFDERLTDDWRQVVDVVAWAMFGTEPEAARLVA